LRSPIRQKVVLRRFTEELPSRTKIPDSLKEFEKVKRRTRRCWLNSCRVRCARKLLYGPTRRALSMPEQPHLHVSDQKPLHFNESESAGKGTLDWKGIPCKPLKSDVAGSRSRLSPSTHMQNDPFSEPPIECTFKLKTSR